jgi:hypothetical protein
MKNEIKEKIFIVSLFLFSVMTIAAAQDGNRKWETKKENENPSNSVAMPNKEPENNKSLGNNNRDKNEENSDIKEKENTHSYEISLENYVVAKIDHPEREKFIEKVRNKIQNLRTEKKTLTIQVVGWTDGTTNYGIPKSRFEIKTDCLEYLLDRISDKELGLLRACEIWSRLSAGIRNTINLSEKLNYSPIRNYDDDKIGGMYRKVVVQIEY